MAQIAQLVVVYHVDLRNRAERYRVVRRGHPPIWGVEAFWQASILAFQGVRAVEILISAVQKMTYPHDGQVDLLAQTLPSVEKVTFEQESHLDVATLNALQNKLIKSV
jgi:hypothetical protein